MRITPSIWLALVALACGQDSVPSTIYLQPWATLRLNTGISSTAEVDFTPHGVTARDSAYPEIGLTDTIKVYHNGTRNVLAANTSWLNAGAVIDRIGTVTGGTKYPNYFDASDTITTYADYTITTTSINAVVFAPLLGFHLTAGGTDILKISLSFYSSIYHIDLFFKRWTGGNVSIDSTTVAKSALENKRIRFKVVFLPGTMDAGATTVQSDGSLVASMVDLDTLVETVFYTYSNTPLWLTFQGQALGGGEVVPANNHMAVAALGYAGLVGENEQFVIETDAAAPTEDPEASLEANSSTPDCDPAAPGESAGVEETRELTLNPAWTSACGSGGSVPSAADLSDDEDWDQ